jgi:hypothetical protein
LEDRKIFDALPFGPASIGIWVFPGGMSDKEKDRMAQRNAAAGPGAENKMTHNDTL